MHPINSERCRNLRGHSAAKSLTSMQRWEMGFTTRNEEGLLVQLCAYLDFILCGKHRGLYQEYQWCV